jgi:hypothetical protein
MVLGFLVDCKDLQRFLLVIVPILLKRFIPALLDTCTIDSFFLRHNEKKGKKVWFIVHYGFYNKSTIT